MICPLSYGGMLTILYEEKNAPPRCLTSPVIGYVRRIHLMSVSMPMIQSHYRRYILPLVTGLLQESDLAVLSRQDYESCLNHVRQR